MEISPGQSNLESNENNFSLIENPQIREDIIARLISLLKMSKEDRFKAGIYVGNEGREWIDQSALCFPILDQDYYQSSEDENST